MILTYPNQTMAWYELVSDAEKKAGQKLQAELKNYLMLALMRTLKKPELFSGAVAFDYFFSTLTTGEIKKQSLRDLGDKCLILSGFFPKQSQKRCVEPDYFISLGSSAYLNLSEKLSKNKKTLELAKLFQLISLEFINMMVILLSAKMIDETEDVLNPLLIYELAKKTKLPFFTEKLNIKTKKPNVFFVEATTLKQ